MTVYAGLADLNSRAGETLDQQAATAALVEASGMIAGYCGWNITQETVTDAAVDGTGTRDIWLPTLRLTDVASVEMDGQSLTYDTHYTWTINGRLHRPSGWPHRPRLLTVTYTHGHERVPDAVRGVCVALALRILDGTSHLSRLTVGAVTESYDPALNRAGLSPDEHATLGPYRILPL